MVGFWQQLYMYNLKTKFKLYYVRGEKFRTAFQQLGGLRALTPAPFMALTASVPANVEAEVKAILELHNCIMVSLPLDRPNIYISTKKKSSLSVRVVLSWEGVLSYHIFSCSVI